MLESSITTPTLLEIQADLEQRLRENGPVAFIRELSSRSPRAQILARDTQSFPNGRRSTRFVFVDGDGREATLTVFSEVLQDGRVSYSLTCEPRSLS